MKYYFVFEKSQEDIPTLIIYCEDGLPYFGASPRVVSVITGEEAIQMFNKLTKKAKETDNNKVD